MSHRPIIDAGPALTFLSVNKERLLIGTIGAVCAPEIVQEEVFRKSQQDERFRAAAAVWRKLTLKWIHILSDDQTPELATVVNRITGLPMAHRSNQPKDLGELMVISHAVVAAEAGDSVTVLIDDGQGARIAASEIHRLDLLRAQGHAVGSISLVSTLTVLERAAGGEHIPDKAMMRRIYERLRILDDGLPPVKATNLLAPKLWGD